MDSLALQVYLIGRVNEDVEERLGDCDNADREGYRECGAVEIVPDDGGYADEDTEGSDHRQANYRGADEDQLLLGSPDHGGSGG